jgi:3-oxoacyl-[acyl-carrier-protein] synthase-3
VTADGAGAEAVYIPAGGSKEPVTADGLARGRDRITMPNGRQVAAAAREGFRALATAMEAESGVSLEEVSYFCLHQPNLFLTREILQDLGIPEERTWINFPRFANTTSATLPITISEATAAGKFRDGEWICLGAVGAGFAGAMQLLRWGSS